jgi:hypothetical protein
VPSSALWFWATGLTQYVKTHVGISVHVCVKYRYGLWTQFLLYVSFFDGNELVGWCCGKTLFLVALEKKSTCPHRMRYLSSTIKPSSYASIQSFNDSFTWVQWTIIQCLTLTFTCDGQLSSLAINSRKCSISGTWLVHRVRRDFPLEAKRSEYEANLYSLQSE